MQNLKTPGNLERDVLSVKREGVEESAVLRRITALRGIADRPERLKLEGVKIRTRTLSIVSLALGVSFAAFYVYSQRVLRGGFAQLEARDAQVAADRVQDALSQELANLDIKMADWSAWDDSYNFIHDHNANFKKSNLVSATLYAMKLNLIGFVDTQGAWVYDRLVDFHARSDESLPETWREFIRRNVDLQSIALGTEHRNGVVVGPDGLMLLSVQPIVTSEGKGPARGILVVGRRLDAPAIEHLAKVTHLNVQIFDRPGPAQVETRTVGEAEMVATVGQNDFAGTPRMTLEVSFPRDVHLLGASTIRSVFSAFWAIGLALLGVLLWALDFSILGPLTRLHRNVAKITGAGDVTHRLPSDRTDEIGALSSSINDMLSSLERSERSVRTLLENSGQGYFTFDAAGVLGPQCSKSAWNLFGCNPVGHELTEFLEAGQDEFKAVLPRLFTGADERFEDVVVDLPAQGTIQGRSLNFVYRPIYNEANKLEWVLTVANDVTELGRMLDSLFPSDSDKAQQA